MPFRRKDDIFSSSSSQRRSHRRGDYRDASVDSLIGTQGGSRREGRRAPGAHQARTNSRNADPRKRRNGRTIDRGEISHVIPKTQTRESNAAYERRSRRESHSYSMGTTRRVEPKRILILAAAVVGVIALVALVVSLVYSGSVSSKMALNDDAAKAALVAPAADTDPYYVLFAANVEEEAQSGFDGADSLILARVDPAAPKVSLLGIPGNMVITRTDGVQGAIGSELSLGGDAALINQVSEFAGVDIAHYVRTDAKGLSGLVDALGGVDVDVTEEVDDPKASSLHISAGQQKLNGEQAVAFAAAANYTGGSAKRAENDIALLESLSSMALQESGVGAASAIDTVADYIKTDYSADGLSALLDKFKGYEVGASITCTVPGADAATSNGSLGFYSSSAWDKTKASFVAGENPADAAAAEVASVNPSKYSVIVKNGSGETGSADQAASALKKAGYKIKETGNADQYVYTETLVIYKKAKSKSAADAIVATLGNGRVVPASIYYSFSSDIQVIVGSDWSGSES